MLSMIASVRSICLSSIGRSLSWLPMPGSMPSNCFIDPILRIFLSWPEEVVHRHLARGHLLLQGHRLLLADLFLGAFDEGDDVAHAEDAARDPLGVEGFERVELLARADEA